jgi:ABC-2 type transport system ATP-binding protein
LGQRWQLHPDLPVLESFELHRIVYDLDRSTFARTRDELMALLDEPTLGLDFDAQHVVRRFVVDYVRSTGAAVILTSHYLADIEALCDR